MSASRDIEFRRLVLDLCACPPDTAALRLATELARLMHLDLQGLFVEDPALSALAGLPGVRELRLPGSGWQMLDPGRITAEIQHMAARAERLLAEVSALAGVPSGFEARRGNIADIIAHAEPTDILLIVEPRGPMDRLGEAFMQRCRAAYRSAASILLVPAAPVRAHGPITVLATAADDPALPAAARLAQRAGEDLVVLAADAAMQQAAREQAVAAGLLARQVRTRPLAHADEITVARTQADLKPRLLVLTRGAPLAADLDGLFRLAGRAGVPVLAVEPLKAAGEQPPRLPSSPPS